MKYKYLVYNIYSNELTKDEEINLENLELYFDTGIKDYEGNNIYDGSIINLGKNDNYKVIFKKGSFGIIKKVKTSYYGDDLADLFVPLSYLIDSFEEIIVIGHITDF